MTDFEPLRPYEGEFPPVAPTPPLPSTSVFTPSGSVSDEKILPGVSPRKLKLIGAKVYRSTNQSIPDSSETAISYDTEVYDEGGFWDIAAPTKLMVPYDGIYAVSFYADFNNNMTGYRRGIIKRNGTSTISLGRGPTTGISTALWMTGLTMKLTAGDYMELAVAQTSGASLNIQSGEDGSFGSIHLIGLI